MPKYNIFEILAYYIFSMLGMLTQQYFSPAGLDVLDFWMMGRVTFVFFLAMIAITIFHVLFKKGG
ncbi:MAG: hypothetical protein KAS32_03370 [Candidatus Peribacteraceae bacterium]|nr:hypothetical protein [Candidatus Peribacteraceae bacterium]